MSFPQLPLSKEMICRKKPRLKPPVDFSSGDGDGDEQRAIMSSPQTVMMDASLFHCTSCSQILQPPTFKILEPPTFKCEVAVHVLCQDCCASYTMTYPGAIFRPPVVPWPEMDRMVRAAMVSSVHKDRGCIGPVPYYELADHIRSRRMMLKLDASFFRCASCSQILKPPTFEYRRAGEHVVVCEDCRASHTDSYPYLCCEMDRMVRGLKVFCVHKDGGCTVPVAYHEMADHLRSCRFVPCACPSGDCTFKASPTALPEHFADHHNWPVLRGLVYGQPLEIAAPDPGRMVALVGEEDDCVFVVYAFALGTATALSVVRMAAARDDASEVAAHQFRCHLWVQQQQGGRNKDHVFSSLAFAVTSSDGSRLPGLTEQGMVLAVPQLPLHDHEPGEPAALMIRIDDQAQQSAADRPPSPLRQ